MGKSNDTTMLAYILDSSSFIHLAQVEANYFSRNPLFKLAQRNFPLYITPKISNEIRGKAPADELLTYLSNRKFIKIQRPARECYDTARRIIRHLAVQLKVGIPDPGELEGMAAALWLSRTAGMISIFFTSDAEALKAADVLLRNNFAGFALSTPELICHLYAIREITLYEAELYLYKLNDFINGASKYIAYVNEMCQNKCPKKLCAVMGSTYLSSS